MTKKNEIISNYKGIIKTDANRVQRLCSLLIDVEKNLGKATDIWTMLDQQTKNVVLERASFAYREIFRRLDAVSNNKMIPELFFANGNAAKAVAKLPVAKQRVIVDKGVPVVVMEKGKPKTVRKQISEVSRAETAQAFKDGEIKTTMEQISHLKNEPKVTKTKDNKTEYTFTRKGRFKIVGKKITFLNEWQTEKDLEEALSQLRKARS